MLAWYLGMFGGERVKLKGRLDAVKYGDVWVLAQRGDATPSAGHAVDHVGWRVTDLATGTIHFGFVEGPATTRIEVVQR